MLVLSHLICSFNNALSPICFYSEEASDIVDVQNIKHLTGNQSLIGDVVEKTAEEWNNRKDIFYQQTGYGQRPSEELCEHGEDENFRQQQGNGNIELEEHYGYSHEQRDDGNREEEEDDDDLVLELEQVLSPDREESE